MRKPAWNFWGVTLILLATLAAYAPTLQASLLNLDDYRYLTAVRPFDLQRIVHLFTHFFEGYHPLSLVSLGMTFALVGFDPWLHHAVNLLLHLVNTALVFVLALRLSRDRLAAGVACAIFGLHPIHVEAVAWVTSRKDVLYACFYLLGLIQYHAAITRGGWPRYAGTGLCFLLAVLAKGMAVSFPLAMIAVDVAQRRPLNARTLVLEKLPFWGGALLFGWISIRAQQASGYVPDLAAAGDWLTRASRALACLWWYAAHTIQLHALTAFHPFPTTTDLHHDALAGAALLIGALAATALAWRRQPAIAAAILLALATIALVLQVVPVADFLVADRYAYVNSIGFCLLVALGVARLWRTPPLRLATALLTLTYLLALGLATRSYATAWRDSESLWSHVIARYPDAAFPLNMRGCARSDLRRYADAIPDFDRAAASAPTYPRTYLNRGFAREKMGDLAGAQADYEHLRRLDPTNPLACNNLGLLYLRLNRPADAVATLDEAIRLAPHHPAAHLFFGNRAQARLAAGDPAGAVADATAAIARFPRHFRAYLTRAEAHAQLGNLAAAESDLAQAAAIDPHDPQVQTLRASLPPATPSL